MKNVFLLLLILFFSTSLLAQSPGNNTPKTAVSNPEILVSPKEFYGTIGLVFNFSETKTANVVVKNKSGRIVFEQKLADVKSSSFKLGLSDLKAEKYMLYIFDGGGKELYNTEIERKN